MKLTQDNPISSVLQALVDQVGHRRQSTQAAAIRLDPLERLDGRTCLVTGANSGLGKAVAIELGRRGARVIMACRSGIPDAGDDVKQQSGSALVEMLPLDLTKFASVQELVQTLVMRRIEVDVMVQNAGVVLNRPSRTQHGFEQMFQVNYLAATLLIRRLLEAGVIRNRTFAEQRPRPGPRPRIVFVSSEAHRTAKPLDLAQLGEPVDYDAMSVIAHYGHTKLALSTFASELMRRLQSDRGVDVAVHALCPGPVSSNMARHSPAWLKPVLGATMRLFFSSPEKAAEPVVYLAGARAIEGRTGLYLHQTRLKEASEAARDRQMGSALWAASEALLRRAGAA